MTSVCLSSSAIAVLALVGGYLVPVIAGRDSGSPVGLDIYLLVVNLGAFAVARFRKWSALDFLASLFGYFFCFIWCGLHASCSQGALLVNFVFISCVHLLYMASVVVGAKDRNRAGNALAWTGLSLGACIYLAWLCAHFHRGFSSGVTGLVFLGVVAVYLAVAGLARRRGWAGSSTSGRTPTVPYSSIPLRKQVRSPSLAPSSCGLSASVRCRLPRPGSAGDVASCRFPSSLTSPRLSVTPARRGCSGGRSCRPSVPVL